MNLEEGMAEDARAMAKIADALILAHGIVFPIAIRTEEISEGRGGERTG